MVTCLSQNVHISSNAPGPLVVVAAREYTENDTGSRKRTKTTRKRSYSSPVGRVASSIAKLTKSSVKSAFEIVSVKHVNLGNILGKWKLTQEVNSPSGIVLTCPATIELLKNGTLIAYFEGVPYHTEFMFKENSWPKRCIIEFSAKIFQGPQDPEPRTMIYKGYFKKSMMNPDVIMMRGDMYQLKGKMYAVEYHYYLNMCANCLSICHSFDN
jgi:hypothetical protein